MTEQGQGLELTARLRELKERSGLSYGTLAQKLHVGTSTLHRYVAGEAVPVEFAIVDRFGRVCGASPDELVALHRAWLLADAQRTRGAEASPPVTEPAAHPDDGPGASGEVPRPPRRLRRLVAVGVAVVVLTGAGIALAGLVEGEPGRPSFQKGAPPANPLTTSVRSNLWESGCDHSYLVDRPPAQVPEPPVEADAPAWAAQAGAVDGGRTIVEVTIAGTEDVPVVLQGLTVRVDKRRAPLDWNVYAMSLGCGGALTPATYAVDLDQPRPIARARAGSDGQKPLPAVTFPFRVSRTEPVVLRVVAQTMDCDCDWYLELAWTAGGGTGTQSIGADGRPFRTSAATGKPYGYLDGWSR